MAMLAEKKRKQKWCLNPRGNYWSDDQNKFGQRLLEKMGWSAGQGLGLNNQGPTEVISVKKKDDNKGLGFKENGEEWIKTTSDYNELLDQLANAVGNENDQTNITSSLEDRSKKSKARVHYHKFTRGKDLSRYSEKDLASIIGPDVLKSKADSDIHSDYKPNQINKGSSTEYFIGKKSCKQDDTSEPITTEATTNNLEEEVDCSFVKKHKKSKRSRVDDLQRVEEPICEIEDTPKKHKHKEVDNEFKENQDLTKKKKTKKKSKTLQEEIEIERKIDIGITELFEEQSTGFDFCEEKKKIHEESKKPKNKININSVELEEDSSIGKAHKEEITHNKLSKNKKKCKKSNFESVNTSNDNDNKVKTELETSDTIFTTQYEDEFNSEDVSLNIYKVIKKSKKVKGLKTEPASSLQTENSVEKVENNLTLKLPKNKKSKATSNSCETSKDCVSRDKMGNQSNNKSISDDGEVVSKKNKILKQHDAEDEFSVGQLEDKNCKSEKRKKSKKTEDNANYDVEDAELNHRTKKRKIEVKNNTDNLISDCNELKNNTLNTDLNYTSQKSEDHILKHSKTKKKEEKAQRNRQPEIEENANVEEISPKLNEVVVEKIRKKQKMNNTSERSEKTEMTTVDNEDRSSKQPNGCLMVFGRQTRLRHINKLDTQVKDAKFETEEFMSFNKKDVAGINGTKKNSPHSEYTNTSKRKQVISYSLTQDSNEPASSLQVKVENKIKMPSDHIKRLGKGKNLPIEEVNNNDNLSIKPQTLHKGSFKNSQDIISQRLCTNNQEFNEDDLNEQNKNTQQFEEGDKDYFSTKQYDSYSSYKGLRGNSSIGRGYQSCWGMGFGHGQTQMGGRGRGSFNVGSHIKKQGRRSVVQGRISKNNFDAKQYARKCKTMNKIPEIVFKGVDLQIISGYAASKKGIFITESSDNKKELKLV